MAAEKVIRSSELSGPEMLEREGMKIITGEGESLSMQIPVSALCVSECGSPAVFCFFGGGGGRYVTTLAFFCGGSFGVMVPKLNGSLNFSLLMSDAFDLPLPLMDVALRVGGLRVDHPESGEGGS